MNKERGKRIRNLMKARGINRVQLADTSGFSISLIGRIRAGHDFTTEVQEVLCEILDTTPNYLHGYTPYPAEIESIAKALHEIGNQDLSAAILTLVNLHRKN